MIIFFFHFSISRRARLARVSAITIIRFQLGPPLKAANNPEDHNSVGFCFATQAMGQLHGRAEEIIVIRYRLTRVNDDAITNSS